jgi:hypothetical protein
MPNGKTKQKINRSIKESLDNIDHLGDVGAQDFVSIINELRRRVIIVLAEEGEISGATAEAVKSRIDGIMTDYRSRFENSLSENQRRLFIKGVQLVDNAVKSGGLIPSVPYLSEQKLESLKRYGAEHITNLTDYARSQIRQEIDLAVLGQKPTSQIVAAIGRDMADPSIFGTLAKRAEVITRTEVNRIQQIATQDRIKQVSAQIPDLEKEWIHGHVGIPRPGHLVLHGVTIPSMEKFELVSAKGVIYMIDGPSDPILPVGEVVNCRCKVAPVVKRFMN